MILMGELKFDHLEKKHYHRLLQDWLERRTDTYSKEKFALLDAGRIY